MFLDCISGLLKGAIIGIVLAILPFLFLYIQGSFIS